jgi:hypothetical protein
MRLWDGKANRSAKGLPCVFAFRTAAPTFLALLVAWAYLQLLF